mmetsp:Transcript_23783/g.40563  ORF Transcript_23783/g.40563 Transcript_23783/m.40563 type:complete len:273 (-) Transcript_23783:332-1150(-)
METIILKTFGNIFLCDPGDRLQWTQIENEFVCALSVLSDEKNIECTIQSCSHVVGIQNGNFSGLLQTFVSIHFNVHPRNGEDSSRSEWSTGHGSFSLGDTEVASAELSGSLGINRMPWKEGCKMGSNANGSNTRSSTAVRDAECFVQVEMAHVGTDETRTSQTNLSIHVGTVHVHLPTGIVHHIDDLNNLLLEHTKGRWVSDHEGCNIFSVFLNFGSEVVNVNVSIGIIVNNYNFHSSHRSRGRVGSVSTFGNKTDIPVSLSASCQVVFDCK